MKNILFALLPLIALYACGGNSWKKSENSAFDFEYQVFTDNPQKTKIDYGDSVFLAYSLRNGSKIIVSSYDTKGLVGLEVPTKMYRNCFEEPLLLVGEGDSMVVQVDPKKCGEAMAEYVKSFSGEEKGLFTYKIYKVKNRAANELEKAKEYAARMGFASVEEAKAEREQLKTYTDTVVQLLAKASEDYKSKKMKDLLKTPSGLEYKLLAAGDTAKLQAGDTLFLHFAFRLLDEDKMIDNTFKTGGRFQYIIGAPSTLVPMWQEGLPLLHRGSRALFFVPAALGYGAEGSLPTVPKNARLVWYVEVKAVR